MPDNPLSPIHDVFGGTPTPGIALCLSGGGYRAMLFHVGSIWRINEAGLLGNLNRISSVSGGSITTAVLGMNWTALGLSTTSPRAADDKFSDFFVEPLRQLAGTTVDAGAILGGIFCPEAFRIMWLTNVIRWCFGEKPFRICLQMKLAHGL